jgi:hypothetical protein
MSPAGSAAASFRRVRRGPYVTGPLLVAALVGLVLVLSGGRTAHTRLAPPVAALSPAWAEFQRDCVSGPSPGQGSSPSGCRCWEAHLEAAAIVPGYAVSVLWAAQAGGDGLAYMVGQNIGNVAVSAAMSGCGLYKAND